MRFFYWGRVIGPIALAAVLVSATLPAASAPSSGEKPASPASKQVLKTPSASTKAARPATSGTSALRIGLDIPDVRSKSALVYDETNGEILFAKKADEALPIASITKLMTALVVLEAGLPLDEKLEITTADRDSEKGSYSRLAIGAKLTRGDLLQLALMSSENRAAHALGRNYPGGLKAFVKAMNVKAKALGMSRTRFVEPTGLSSKNVASPADLSKLVMAAAEDATIREFSTYKEYAVTVGRQVLTFRNTNNLVSNPSWDVLVQKTGFINEAGQCLVMKAMIDGRAVVFVLLDSFGKYTRVADAKRIRTWMQAKQISIARAP